MENVEQGSDIVRGPFQKDRAGDSVKTHRAKSGRKQTRRMVTKVFQERRWCAAEAAGGDGEMCAKARHRLLHRPTA